MLQLNTLTGTHTERFSIESLVCTYEDGLAVERHENVTVVNTAACCYGDTGQKETIGLKYINKLSTCDVCSEFVGSLRLRSSLSLERDILWYHPVAEKI